MDNLTKEQKDLSIFIQRSNSIFSSKHLVYVLILLLGFFLGFLLFYVLSFGRNSNISKPIADRANTITPSIKDANPHLPIELSLLTNPIVYEWRGDVAGKLIKTDPSYFTLQSDNGNSITIYFTSTSGRAFDTKFSKLVNQKWQDIKLSDIPIGTKLVGTFFIFNGDSTTPIGSNFQIKE